MESDRTVLVTGAASGIGRAVAERLAREEMTVVVADVNYDGAENVARDLRQAGGRGEAILLDVTDSDSVAEAIATVHRRLGPVTDLVNNAGIGVPGTVLATSPEEFMRVMTVNVLGTFMMTQHVLPDMVRRGAGTIVNVGSVAGMVGIRNRAAYSASKGAVLALTRSVHADFHQHGIRVNAVVPGTIETPWIARITAEEPDPAVARQDMAARQPIGRMGTAEEVAESVWFLLGPTSSFVYGSFLIVDGGLTAL